MLNSLKLLIPALIPSWRFFDLIAPSPRVQFALLDSQQGTAEEWYDFNPRPEHLAFGEMLFRLIWNPGWNETLFVMSCAERLMENPTEHSESEIMKRIQKEVKTHHLALNNNEITHLQFRLFVVERQGEVLQESVTYYSRIESVSRDAPR